MEGATLVMWRTGVEAAAELAMLRIGTWVQACTRNRRSVDTARPRLDGLAAMLLPELEELTGIEPVTS